MLGLAAACGQVQLVRAPFTPADVELSYAADEDLTRVRWNVGDSTSITFEIASGGDYVPVDFSAAPYVSGAWDCNGRRCYQLVVRGNLAAPPNGVLVRANHASLGRFPGERPVRVTPSSTVTVKFALGDGNAHVHGDIDDWLTAPGLERQFGTVFFAGCGAPPDVDPITLHVGAQDVPFSLSTDDGHYCGRVRPEAADHGPRASFVAPFDAFPETFRQELHWAPPRETAPVVWRFVADLQIADPARCDKVSQTVHDLFAAAFAAAGNAHELQRVDLAPGCHQDPGRALDGAGLADDAKSYLASTSSNQWQRPVLVYVNNLDAPLPQSLVDSLDVYRGSFSGKTVPLDLALATDATFLSTGWDVPLQFAAIEDPQLAQTIQAAVMANLPVTTELHDDADILPLMPPDTVTAEAGHPWKLCQASPAIQRMDGVFPIDDSDLTPLIHAQAPPGFMVTLPPKILVPAALFAPDDVLVRWEICRRWCDHAFTDESGAVRPNWSTTPACVRNSVP
jgi:hypothetical protein